MLTNVISLAFQMSLIQPKRGYDYHKLFVPIKQIKR